MHREKFLLRKNNQNFPKMLCNLVVRCFGKKKSIYLKPLKKYLHEEIISLKFILRNYLKNFGLYYPLIRFHLILLWFLFSYG